MTNNLNTHMNKMYGALFAHACGDYLGMPVEFASTPEQVKNFFGEEGIRPLETNSRGIKPPGYYTDDTAMMLCLAQSLIDRGFDTKDQFAKYKKWAFEGYMSADGKTSFGIGQNTLRKLMWQKVEDIPETINSNEKEGGNGALMRCLPIGLIYHNNIDELIDKSIKSALVTHNNDVAVWCTVVFNALIAYSLQGFDKKEFTNRIKLGKIFPKLPDEIQNVITNIRHKDKTALVTSGYSINTLETALYCFLHTETLQDAITEVIGLGGDTDTQGAVTGGLAGAYYGYDSIPKHWIDSVQNKDLVQEIALKITTLSSVASNT